MFSVLLTFLVVTTIKDFRKEIKLYYIFCMKKDSDVNYLANRTVLIRTWKRLEYSEDDLKEDLNQILNRNNQSKGSIVSCKILIDYRGFV